MITAPCFLEEQRKALRASFAGVAALYAAVAADCDSYVQAYGLEVGGTEHEQLKTMLGGMAVWFALLHAAAAPALCATCVTCSVCNLLSVTCCCACVTRKFEVDVERSTCGLYATRRIRAGVACKMAT